MEYLITVTNAAGASQATSIVVADDPSSEMAGPNPTLAFVGDVSGAAGDIRVVHTPAAVAPATTGLIEEVDGEDGQFIANTVTVSKLTLNAGDQTVVSFRVEIQ